MNKSKERLSRILRLLFAAVLAAATWPALLACAQDAPAAGNSTDQTAPSAQSPATQAEPKPIPPTAQPPKEEPPKDEVKITPRQAEELFHSVDEILDFDSKQTGLPIKKEV